MKNEYMLDGAAGKHITLDVHLGAVEGPAPLVLYAHGFNGFKDWGNGDLMARYFTDAGLHFLKFNFSHNGTTPAQQEAFADPEAFGHNNFTKQLFDLRQVTDWICSSRFPFRDRVDTGNIILIGHSMGGGTSVLYASEDIRISQLITWAAIGAATTPWGKWNEEKMRQWREQGVAYYTNSRTGQDLPLYYQLYEDFCRHTGRLDIQRAAREIRVPWLICHGREDTAVACEVAVQLHSLSPVSGLCLLDSGHTFGRTHPWTEDYFNGDTVQLLEKTILHIKAHIR